MSLLFRWLFYSSCVLVSVLVLAVLIVILWFNPNQYKPDINDWLSTQSGRSVQVTGDLSWTFFPWLGLQTEGVEVAQTTGFDQTSPFAQWQQAAVRIKLLPLLRRQVEVDEVLVTGLQLNLQRDAEGKANWADLLPVAPSINAPAPITNHPDKPAAPEPAMAWVIAGVTLKQARIHYQDQQSQQQISLQAIQVKTSALRANRWIDLDWSARLHTQAEQDQAKATQLAGHTTIKATSTQVDFKDAVFSLKLAQLPEIMQQITVNLPDLKIKPAELLQTSPIQLSFAGQSIAISAIKVGFGDHGLSISPLKIVGLGMKLSVDWQTSSTAEGTSWQSHWVVDKFSPKQVLANLGLPPMLLPAVHLFSHVGLIFDLGGESEQLWLQNLRLNIDQQSLQCQRIDWFSQQQKMDIQALSVSLGELNLQADMQIQQALNWQSPDFKVQGKLVSNQFNPQQLLSLFGQPPLQVQNPQRFKQIEWQLAFVADQQNLHIDELQLSLDESHLSGELIVQDWANPRIHTELEIDRLNVDDYMSVTQTSANPPLSFGFIKVAQPPPFAPPFVPPAPPFMKPAPSAVLPDFLKQIDLNAHIWIKQFQYAQIKMQDLLLSAQHEDQVLHLYPQSLLYQGQWDAHIALYLNSPTRMVAKIHSQAVMIEDLLTDVSQQGSQLRGQMQLAADIETDLDEATQVQQNLRGVIKLALTEGALKGVNLLKILDQTRIVLGKKAIQNEAQSQAKETAFEYFKGTFKLQNQILVSDNLSLLAPRLRVTGKGNLDLVQQSLDYQLLASVLDSKNAQAARLTIPVSVSGQVDAPKVRPDVSGLLNHKDNQFLRDKLKQKAVKGLLKLLN